ncbi:unnamed protein product [marine sediment metagenome]|uniref:Uncharacterized protein n=1 Tax=marine sediment metagenome TaxID=412755 RepID=X1TSE3_9ZZZZ
MDQEEFETRRSAQKKALKAIDEKPIIKVIDLVELLLLENPGRPVVVQVGTRQFPIAYVRADDEDNIQLGI